MPDTCDSRAAALAFIGGGAVSADAGNGADRGVGWRRGGCFCEASVGGDGEVAARFPPGHTIGSHVREEGSATGVAGGDATGEGGDNSRDAAAGPSTSASTPKKDRKEAAMTEG